MACSQGMMSLGRFFHYSYARIPLSEIGNEKMRHGAAPVSQFETSTMNPLGSVRQAARP
jgi:hypothetical protein